MRQYKYTLLKQDGTAETLGRADEYDFEKIREVLGCNTLNLYQLLIIKKLGVDVLFTVMKKVDLMIKIYATLIPKCSKTLTVKIGIV